MLLLHLHTFSLDESGLKSLFVNILYLRNIYFYLCRNTVHLHFPLHLHLFCVNATNSAAFIFTAASRIENNQLSIRHCLHKTHHEI